MLYELTIKRKFLFNAEDDAEAREIAEQIEPPPISGMFSRTHTLVNVDKKDGRNLLKTPQKGEL